MQLDSSEILRILPHRPPLLLVDRVLYLEPLERGVALKNVTSGEPGFDGRQGPHDYLPELLTVEAAAQLSALVLISGGMEDGRIVQAERKAFDGVFAAIPGLSWRPFPGPGTLTLSVERTRVKGKMHWMVVTVYHELEREPILEGRLTFFFTKGGSALDAGFDGVG